jgi:uncharacterized membrane protein YeaQ/YmgE (transglycosylase-associated protein family)
MAVMMGIVCWIILGLIASFIAHKVVGGRGDGVPVDIVLGLVGALISAWLVSAFRTDGVTGLNVWSLFVAIVGATVLLVLWHTIRGRISRA